MWLCDVFRSFRDRMRRTLKVIKNSSLNFLRALREGRFWREFFTKLCVVGWLLSGYLIGAAWFLRSLLAYFRRPDLAEKIPEPVKLIDPGLIIVVGLSVLFSAFAAACMYLTSSASRSRSEFSAVIFDEISSICIGYGALILFYTLRFDFDGQLALIGLGITMSGIVSFNFSYLVRNRLDRST